VIGSDPLDLGGHVALVTGAGQRLGRAIALTLAHHNVGGIAVNDFVAERAAAVVEEIEALGVKAAAVPFDVGDHAAVKSAFADASDKLGPITILVNNAGNAGPNARMRQSPLFWETDPSEWDRYFHTNVRGVMNCCHVALPAMVAQGRGRILTIVSDAARIGEARLAAYSAAKAGAAGFIRAIAREAGRYSITSNAISLSTLAPDFDDPADKDRFLASEQARAIVSKYAIRRLGSPDDVTTLALFLCSEASGWITGQTYPVNGGYSFAV
jgi:NAD(P)-dependent dehydrogenase (short-subunit alcohol dehydrogenase family)